MTETSHPALCVAEAQFQPVDWQLHPDTYVSREVARFRQWSGINIACEGHEIGLRCNRAEEWLDLCGAWLQEKLGEWQVLPARSVEHTFWLWLGGRICTMRDYHYWGQSNATLLRSVALERVLRKMRFSLSVHLSWQRDQIWVDGSSFHINRSAILVMGGRRGALAQALGSTPVTPDFEKLDDPFLINSRGVTARELPIKIVLFADGRHTGAVRSSRLGAHEAAERLVQGAETRLHSKEVFHQVRWALESASCYRVEGDPEEFVRRVKPALERI